MPRPRRFPSALYRRLAAAIWTARGRRRLSRDDLAGSILALERALRLRPGSFVPLMLLTRAYLRQREMVRAHRALAQARESDPVRFARVASDWLAREGVDLSSFHRTFGVSPARRPADARAASATALHPAGATRTRAHPYGDCRDLDEYAHFQAMPPITRAERESVDWDEVVSDLLDE
jgi:hypothetical protein